MKKFTILVKEDDNQYTEKIVFATSKKECKAIFSPTAIIEESNVKHPSPEVLQRVLLTAQIDGELLDLVTFYTNCEIVRNLIESEQTTL